PRGAGLFSALIYAVTLNGIYISRAGMQESYVIFFILFSLYFFIRAINLQAGGEKYFLITGVVLGLGTLAKYTTFFVTLPIIFIYLLLFRLETFFKKKFWLSVILFFVMISPSIIYNIELYRAVGHFDFQLSTIFGQTHPAWQVQPGKDIGSVSDRISALVPRMIATNSWVFLSLFVISILGFLFSIFRNGRETIKKYSFLIISFVCIVALLLVIGPSYRFLTMLMPFMALSIGVLLSHILSASTQYEKSSPLHSISRSGKIIARTANRKRFFVLFGLVIFFLFEIFYSWNNQIAYYPIGRETWFASKVRYENYNWGYNELNNYFENEFKNKIPALTFDLRYQFLDKLRDDALSYGLQKGYQKYPALVVYFGNFDQAGKLWSFDRLHIYHAWPVISLQDYYDYLTKNGQNFYTEAGFKNYYFIMPTNSVPTAEFKKLIQGAEIIEIKNPREDTAFLVYKK
ncbi:MAG: glycosyltransferase family 39 protein, partial [Patescibacteria group bacterium]